MDKLDKDYFVIQNNDLIERKKYLTLEEQKIILIFASLIKPEDTSFKTYEVKAEEIIKLLNIKNQGKYTALKNALYSLASKPIKIEKGNSFIIQHWFNYAEYNNGILKVEFHKDLQTELLQLKQFFTNYQLNNILYLKSKYSIQIYEFLKSNAFKKSIEISVEDLRKFLHVENKYKKYNDFKKNTLEKAHDEINKITDISFKYEEIKQRKKVVSICFHIKNKIFKNDNKLDNNLLEEVMKITENNFTKNQSEKLLKIANNDIDKINTAYLKALGKGKKIKNLFGWIFDCIKNEYKDENNTEVIDSFNNYEQRTYDFKELERKLLGWDKEEEDNN